MIKTNKNVTKSIRPFFVISPFNLYQRNYKKEAQLGKSNSLVSIDSYNSQTHSPFHQYKNVHIHVFVCENFFLLILCQLLLHPADK